MTRYYPADVCVFLALALVAAWFYWGCWRSPSWKGGVNQRGQQPIGALASPEAGS